MKYKSSDARSRGFERVTVPKNTYEKMQLFR